MARSGRSLHRPSAVVRSPAGAPLRADDEDCDGLADDDDTDGADGNEMAYVDSDGDAFGDHDNAGSDSHTPPPATVQETTAGDAAP